MGYRAEKLKVEKRLKIVKRVVLGILLLCIAGLCIFAAFVPPDSWKYYVDKPDVPERKAGELRVHFIDVGQGDATLIELPDGRNFLIDGGDGSEEATKSLLRYLNALDIEQIDYLLVTHADKDHCGGLDKVLEYFDVFVAYLPPSLPEANTEYAEFYAALSDTDCRWQYTSRKISNITSQDARYPYTLCFLYPYEEDVEYITGLKNELSQEDENLYCGIVWLDYQGSSVLFTGDAPASVEERLRKVDEKGYWQARGVCLDSTEIIKVSHHGSADATSEEFLKYLHVQTAIISCGKGNEYGHPAPTLLSKLTSVGINYYRTDVDGHTMATLYKNGKYQMQNIK